MKPTSEQIGYIREVVEKYSGKLDPMTIRLLQMREKGWDFGGLRSYIVGEYKWLIRNADYKWWGAIIVLPYYVVKFIIR